MRPKGIKIMFYCFTLVFKSQGQSNKIPKDISVDSMIFCIDVILWTIILLELLEYSMVLSFLPS